ncbi:unnamed protein product [Porites evermanni]|uniref:Uncharacterized protein n=1 Tax=Porites evermanni TaxID=104178 RepID=A0ABN8S8E3_9CNID|nr:unnamed protein product [Porites evermanni]CAH3193401.1 unnamed protein product [Porites evermanni]
MLAQWEEEIPEDVAHLDISKVYDLGGTRNSKKCEVHSSNKHPAQQVPIQSKERAS